MNTENVGTSALVFLSIVASVVVLYLLQPILMPFVIAVMLSYLLSPLVERMAKYKVPRILTLLVVFFLAFALLGNAAKTLAQSLLEFSSNIPAYSDSLQEMIQQYSTDYPIIEESLTRLSSLLFSLPYATVANSALSSTIGYLSNTFLILLFVTYLCLAGHRYREKIAEAFPGARGKHIQKISDHINQDIRKYISIHTLISLATGVSAGIACAALGVPFALLWGFLAFLLNYIPTIGSILASVPPIITAAVVLGLQPALLLAALLIGIQLVWGNIVEPKIAGDSLGISPLVILLSLVFWGWLWGVVGAILAVPIAVMIKVTCANIPSLKPISVLMAD